MIHHIDKFFLSLSTLRQAKSKLNQAFKSILFYPDKCFFRRYDHQPLTATVENL